MLQFAESREYTVNHLLNPRGAYLFQTHFKGGLSGEGVVLYQFCLPCNFILSEVGSHATVKNLVVTIHGW